MLSLTLTGRLYGFFKEVQREQNLMAMLELL